MTSLSEVDEPAVGYTSLITRSKEMSSIKNWSHAPTKRHHLSASAVSLTAFQRRLCLYESSILQHLQEDSHQVTVRFLMKYWLWRRSVVSTSAGPSGDVASSEQQRESVPVASENAKNTF